MSLKEKLTQPPARTRVVTDCVQLVDDEVKGKGGLTGIAIKGAYGVVKTVKPGFVNGVVDDLLDEWVDKLEPFYADWDRGGRTPALASYLAGRKAEIAERLLEVTDAKAGHAKNATVKKTYEKLRPTAKKHVEEAVPGLARVVEKHAG